MVVPCPEAYCHGGLDPTVLPWRRAKVAPAQTPNDVGKSATRPCNLFDIVLHKPRGARYGFTVVAVTLPQCNAAESGASGVYVKSVEAGGVIEQHNRTCTPQKVISAGDCIVRAGDATLDANGIMKALGSAESMRVFVLRQVDLQGCGLESLLKSVPQDMPALDEESVPDNLARHLGEAAAQAPEPEHEGRCADAFLEPDADGEALGESAVGSARAHAKSANKIGKVKVQVEEPEDALKSRPTTLMLQQVPTAFSRDLLAGLLNDLGFAGLYDFVYMRMSLQKQMPFTYAFVNLVTPEAAFACHQALDGYSGWGPPGTPPCIALWANSQQGLLANIERYRNSPVMHKSMPDAFKPAVYQNGARVPFPQPTKPLKPPPAPRHTAAAHKEEAVAPKPRAHKEEAVPKYRGHREARHGGYYPMVQPYAMPVMMVNPWLYYDASLSAL